MGRSRSARPAYEVRAGAAAVGVGSAHVGQLTSRRQRATSYDGPAMRDLTALRALQDWLLLPTDCNWRLEPDKSANVLSGAVAASACDRRWVEVPA
jgi:hypothetical protein